MRRLFIMLLLAAGVLLLLVVAIRRPAAVSTNQLVSATRGDPRPLTQQEEQDLLTFTQASLRWSAFWTPQPQGCTQGTGSAPLDIAGFYRKYEGQPVLMNLSVSELYVSAYFASLHTWMGFRRLHEKGLDPPTVRFYCEDTYQEFLESEQRYVEQSNRWWDQVHSQIEADPSMKEILDSIRRRSPQNAASQAKHEETRSFFVQSLALQPVEPEVEWSEEKKQFFASLIEVLREEVLACADYSDDHLTMTFEIPDFALGDGEIHVLRRAPLPYGIAIEKISFGRNKAGEYYAIYSKELAITDNTSPHESRAPKYLRRWKALIESRVAKTIILTCAN